MTNQAFSYIRCSTKEQLKGASIARQLEAAQSYCAKNGLVLSDKGYTDLGLSAFTDKNLSEGSDLMALITAIEKGVIPSGSTLVIENLDRLSRSFITTSLPLFMRMLSSGIRIVTLSDGKMYDKDNVNKNPLELLFSIMIFARAHEESQVKKLRIGDAWKRAQTNLDKIKIKNSYPSWLTLSDNRFSVIEDRAALVRRVFDLYTSGNSITGICRLFNNEGILTFSGKNWKATSLKFTLKNPAVIGEYHVGRREKGKKVKTGQIAENYYPIIITKDTWNKAQAKLLLNPSKIGRPQREDANLFSGIIKCGYCGGSMGISNGRESKSFICWNSVNGGCVRAGIPVNLVEGGVFGSTETIAEMVTTDTMKENDESKSVEGEIIELKQRRDKLIDLVEKVGDATSIAPRLDAINIKLKKLENQLSEIRIIATAKNGIGVGTRLILRVVEHVATPGERLSIVPSIRRCFKRIECYALGDKFEEYKKALVGKNGSLVYKKLRKKFAIDEIQYVKVTYNYPVRRTGVPRESFQFFPIRYADYIKPR